MTDYTQEIINLSTRTKGKRAIPLIVAYSKLKVLGFDSDYIMKCMKRAVDEGRLDGLEKDLLFEINSKRFEYIR